MILLPLLLLLTPLVYGAMEPGVTEPASHTVPASISLNNMANEEQSSPHSDSDSMPSGKIQLKKTDDEKTNADHMTESAKIQPAIKLDATEEDSKKTPEGGQAPKGGKVTIKKTVKHTSGSATVEPEIHTEEVVDDSSIPESDSGVLKGKSVRKLRKQKIVGMTGSATMQPSVQLGDVASEQLDTPEGAEAPQGDESSKVKKTVTEHTSGSAAHSPDAKVDGDEVTETREGNKVKRIHRTRKTEVHTSGSATLPPGVSSNGGEEEPETPKGGDLPEGQTVPPGGKLDGDEVTETRKGNKVKRIHRTRKTEVHMAGSATLPPGVMSNGGEEEPETPKGGELPEGQAIPPGGKLDGGEKEPETSESGKLINKHVRKTKKTNVNMSGSATLPPGVMSNGGEEEPETPKGGELPKDQVPEGSAAGEPKTPEDGKISHENRTDKVKEREDRPHGSATILPNMKMAGIEESPTTPKMEPLINEKEPLNFKPSDSQPVQQPQDVGIEPPTGDMNGSPPHVPEIQRDSQLPRVNDQPPATIEKVEPPVGILPAIAGDRKPEQQCTAMEQAIGDSCYCKEGFVRVQGAGCKPLQCAC